MDNIKTGNTVSFLSYYNFTSDGSDGFPPGDYVSSDRKRFTGVVTKVGVGFRKNGIQVQVSDGPWKTRKLYQPDGVKLVG